MYLSVLRCSVQHSVSAGLARLMESEWFGSTGYEEAQPMVFCGMFPTDADQYNDMREALGRLQLNDAALSFEPEVSSLHRFIQTRPIPSKHHLARPCKRLLGTGSPAYQGY